MDILKVIKTVLAPLASLWLTVLLLAMTILLVFAGTTVQKDMGIWQVQDEYFHSFATWIDAPLLLPLVQKATLFGVPARLWWAAIIGVLTFSFFFQLIKVGWIGAQRRFRWPAKVPGWLVAVLFVAVFFMAMAMAVMDGFPFPGGYTLIALLLVNLVAAHSVRFKFNWKRSGVILIHVGIILLLLGELITSLFAVEQQMQIAEGQTVNFAADNREAELAVIDKSDPNHDAVVAIDDAALRDQRPIKHENLPFEVKVDEWYANAAIPELTDEMGRPVGGPKGDAKATAGFGADGQMTIRRERETTGVGEQTVDAPAAFVSLWRGGQSIGTYLVSTFLNNQKLEVDGKPYELSLRFRRYYKPYSVHLIDFRFDRYPGTGVAKNYSSEIRLVDPRHGEDRQIKIWMNHPLRYDGETFFQQSFFGERITVLQVVRNPGWILPYISCTVAGVGMIVHFGITLVGFLRRRALPQAFPAPAGTGARAPIPVVPASKAPSPRNGGKKGRQAGAPLPSRSGGPSSYTLEPRRRFTSASFLVPAGAALLCVIGMLAAVSRPAPKDPSYNFTDFGKISIVHGGRVQPLDSLARNTLRSLSGKDTFNTYKRDDKGEWVVDQKRVPAIKWLADVLGRRDGVEDYKVFRVDHPELVGLLGGDPNRDKLFSLRDIAPHVGTIGEQATHADNVKPPSNRTLYQVKVIDLAKKIQSYQQLVQIFNLHTVPSGSNRVEDWQQLGAAFTAGPAAGRQFDLAQGFASVLAAYHADKPADFNRSLQAYTSMLKQEAPDAVEKGGFESAFNRVSPFTVAIVFYLAVFLLAAFSWVGWSRPLSRAAYVVLILTFIFHGLALGGRVYLSGRPPVTNLYSSAIFISFGAVLLAIGLEAVLGWVFRIGTGIGSAAAALIAVPSLVIAEYYLAADGDTMQVLQAVLDTNFWLWTHVLVVTMGYAATFLAGFLALAYIFAGVFTPALGPTQSSELSKTWIRIVYGILCFAMLFSFVGTVLGGIWADQSWGRFWGWDPKENGAVLIVLWNALILHARWGGLVRERGVAGLAVIGNIITAWSWFGTNMLGIGLHAYGFMDSATFWLGSFIALQLLFVALAALPAKLWLSFATNAAPVR